MAYQPGLRRRQAVNPRRRVVLFITIAALVAVGFCAFRFGGHPGIFGFFVGAGASTFSVLTLAILSQALTRTLPPREKGIRSTVLLLLFKLPVFLVAVYLGTTLPPAGFGFFLGGIAVVYSCTVWFLASATYDGGHT